MRRKQIIINLILIMTFCFAQTIIEPHRLNGLHWDSNSVKDSNYLYFDNDSSYVEYIAAIGTKCYGKYFVLNDTLILNQIRGEFDDTFPVGSIHRQGKLCKKFVFVKNYLVPYTFFLNYYRHMQLESNFVKNNYMVYKKRK